MYFWEQERIIKSILISWVLTPHILSGECHARNMLLCLQNWSLYVQEIPSFVCPWKGLLFLAIPHVTYDKKKLHVLKGVNWLPLFPIGPDRDPLRCPLPWLSRPFTCSQYNRSISWNYKLYPWRWKYVMFLSVSAYKSTLCQSKEYQNLNNRHSENLKAQVTLQIAVFSVVKLGTHILPPS